MITTVLWPFAYKYTELLYNHLNVREEGLSPAEKFPDAQIKIETSIHGDAPATCLILVHR